MLVTSLVEVKSIFQNLHNLRTVAQKDDISAMRALIAVNPEYFYGLMDSIIESGYVPIESLVIIQRGPKKFIVHEGNRRLAIMKILLGLIDADEFELPQALLDRIAALTSKWKKDNAKVPCLVFKPTDMVEVDRIVGIVHGKGEKAGRLRWSSVARAREARDVHGRAQPGLDLLESYLKSGKNLNGQQKEKWSGEYNLSVLDEAIVKLAPRLSFATPADMVAKYPGTSYRRSIEDLLHAIGTATVGFPAIRNANDDVFVRYGFPPVVVAPGSGGSGKGGAGTGAGAGAGAGSGTGAGAGAGKRGVGQTYASNDPKSVIALLKDLKPVGAGRQKVVELKKEALKLKIEQTPLAFCFVLRSMFEISAKAYCDDHKIKTYKEKKTTSGKTEKTTLNLAALLTVVADHLMATHAASDIKKQLHGAKVELGKSEGLLSVTSMNQLVHNPSFSVTPGDISRTINNIFPLLSHMN